MTVVSQLEPLQGHGDREGLAIVLVVGLPTVPKGSLPALAPSEPILLLVIASLFLWELFQRAPMET